MSSSPRDFPVDDDAAALARDEPPEDNSRPHELPRNPTGPFLRGLYVEAGLERLFLETIALLPRRRPQEQSPQVEISLETCTACMEEFDINSLHYLECRCPYCQECLNRFFRVGCAYKASFPPRCCGRPLRISIWGRWLDEDIVDRYKAIEKEITADRPLYCANAKCSSFIPKKNQISDALRYCSDCLELTCLKCRSDFNQHQFIKDQNNRDALACPADDAALRALKNLSAQNEWKQCPTCMNVVERVSGCNHMNCVCGVEFCYRCGSRFVEDGTCQCRTRAL